jgi:hypothetical protein
MSVSRLRKWRFERNMSHHSAKWTSLSSQWSNCTSVDNTITVSVMAWASKWSRITGRIWVSWNRALISKLLSKVRLRSLRKRSIALPFRLSSVELWTNSSLDEISCSNEPSGSNGTVIVWILLFRLKHMARMLHYKDFERWEHEFVEFISMFNLLLRFCCTLNQSLNSLSDLNIEPKNRWNTWVVSVIRETSIVVSNRRNTTEMVIENLIRF